MKKAKQTLLLALATIVMTACSTTQIKSTPAIDRLAATATPLPAALPTALAVAATVAATATSVPEALPLLPAMMLGPVTNTVRSPTNQFEATLINTAGDTSTSFLLTIDRAQGGDKWTVLKAKQNVVGGVAALVPMGWSPDEQYFYYTRMYAGAGCDAFLSGSELNQVSIASHKVRTFSYDVGGPMALSPDTKTLAQVVYEEAKPARTTRRKATATPTPNPADAPVSKMTAKLVLRDVGGRRERSIVLAETSDTTAFQAGSIVWKPDGSAIMLTYAHNACNAEARYSVVEVNVQTLQPRVIVDKDARLFTTQVWAEGGWVELLDRQQNRWLLDPTNGQVAKAS